MSDLDDLRIARPCPASWSEMEGGERVRHCGRCRLHVYNVAAMAEAEALRLIHETEGRTCVRLYRRSDGTVLTRDCPGPRPEPASAGRRVAMAAALAGALVASDAVVERAVDVLSSEVAILATPVDDGDWVMGEVMPPAPVLGVVEPPPPPPPPPGWRGG